MVPAIDFLLAGGVILAVVWLPLLLDRSPLSLPIFAVATGWLMFGHSGRAELISSNALVAEVLTEIVLVVAVMGAGLKIDRLFSVSGWASTWRLLAVVLPLSVAGTALLAVWLLDVPPGLGILIGAILAPTDPVLASSVGLGPPGRGEEGEVRFALTSEAGLNDGVAFPFVILGMTLMAEHPGLGQTLGEWAAWELLWKLGAGIAVGLAVGWGLVRLSDALPERFRLSRSGEGLAVIGIMFLAYGLAELISANGFVAVFVTGAAIRHATAGNLDYTKENYAFAEQIERLLMTIILLLFGGVLATGILEARNPAHVLFAVLALLAVRPLAVLIGFRRSAVPIRQQIAIGYFGIRGLGSFFYASYAVSQGAAEYRTIWSGVSLTVLLSVILYGVSSGFVMRRLGGEKR